MPDRNKLFRGKPKKVEIVSNNTVFFSPEPEEEIEQKLTVSSSGDVRFSAYQFDDTILRKQHFKIEPDAADAILNAVVELLQHCRSGLHRRCRYMGIDYN